MSTATERINLRLQLNARRSIERAASFEGKTISNFILACALSQAEKVIHEHEVIRLNSQDSEAFFNALEKPVDFNNKLIAALSEHSERVIHK
ncbi:DUF1778 domain-containing protein [Xenorhabdus bovienii]|uniref:DUF1778 domain-containing protein n=1 Tax=Photorhabdus stackebrandtii TaxID=1123042 RepID=A0A7X5QQX1_9GAMM|nr:MULTISPECIES: DUF1778 domain-containing protein [Morganellaceae]MDE9564961.1 DUF1778 domain-containing protein [Xenorhabdus bovienii]NHB98888.1 DUF1778 domain-containing protein [Photorhabdus stackebrandtii]